MHALTSTVESRYSNTATDKPEKSGRINGVAVFTV